MFPTNPVMVIESFLSWYIDFNNFEAGGYGIQWNQENGCKFENIILSGIINALK